MLTLTLDLDPYVDLDLVSWNCPIVGDFGVRGGGCVLCVCVCMFVGEGGGGYKFLETHRLKSA